MRYEMLRRIVIENFERGESAVLYLRERKKDVAIVACVF